MCPSLQHPKYSMSVIASITMGDLVGMLDTGDREGELEGVRVGRTSNKEFTHCANEVKMPLMDFLSALNI